MPASKPTTINRMNPLEIGWVAGIIEGEGTIRAHSGKYARITVHMTDKDVVERLQSVTGVGHISSRAKSSELSKKPSYTWSVQNAADVAHLLCSIVPLLGERRRQQANVTIEAASRIMVGRT